MQMSKTGPIDESAVWPRRMTFAAALDEAMAQEMREDSGVFCMGTALSVQHLDEFGPRRVRRMPISEPLFTGMAVGAAAVGLRPVVIWRNVTFGFVAFDQVANQAAKLRYMTGGQCSVPMVIRCYGGAGIRLAAQHSQSPYALFAHLPGLKVVAPSNAADAYGLMRAAIRDDNPVMSFESTILDSIEDEIPGPDHVVKLGAAAVAVPGSDVTVVGVGSAMRSVHDAGREALARGISIEIIDLRSIVPLDLETILESVRRTGRLIVVDEAPPMCSVASEICASVAEDEVTSRALRFPVRRVCGGSAPVPYAPVLEDELTPSAGDVLGAVDEMMNAEVVR
jgi:acetoin:2,6-dichlorophenolindophenol oxidoreductase subunit beta